MTAPRLTDEEIARIAKALARASRTDRDLGGAFGRQRRLYGCGCDSCESGWCCGWAAPPW